MIRILLLAAAGAVAAVPAPAQQRPAPSPRPGGGYGFLLIDGGDRARLGITVGRADTLGLPVTEVVEGGPAERAGVRAGDRLTAIDAVGLRVARDDADDPSSGDLVARRLTRYLDGKSPGTEVALQLVRDGRTRTVRVTTVRGDSLRPGRAAARRRAMDQAALGLSLGGSPSRRDTAGVLVVGVVPDGPAEKAGIVEGDRIAAIGGTSLRVDPEDAGDALAVRARVARLTKAVAALAPGEVAELTVVRDGRTRTVRVTTGRASELAGAATWIVGDAFGGMLGGPPWPRGAIPEIRVWRTPDGGSPDLPWDDMRAEIERMMERVREEFRRAVPPGGRGLSAARRGVIL